MRAVTPGETDPVDAGPDGGPISLLDVAPGTRVLVRRVLFYTVRSVCDELGVVPGAELEVCSPHGSGVVVRLDDGRRPELQAALARFVEVEPLGADRHDAGVGDAGERDAGEVEAPDSGRSVPPGRSASAARSGDRPAGV